ncbi:cupin domain-containing protein [Thermodesulfobacteriota bacterium]
MDTKGVQSMKGSVMSLAGMVSYQEGSVVSREVVKKPTGTVTVFAFDEGQGLSEHTAPFDAMVTVLDGEAEIRISGQPHRLRSGDFIIIPANEPHAVSAVQQFKMLLVMVKSQTL